MGRISFSTVQRPYIFCLALILVSGVAEAQHGKRRPSPGEGAGPSGSRLLAVQVALDRAGFSPGEIDGQGGAKTRLALLAFQTANALPSTGTPDARTLAALRPASEPAVRYTIGAEDVAGPFIGTMPLDMMESAKLPALGYTSALEGLAEKFHSSQELLRRLNPGASWATGEVITVPDVEPFVPPAATPAARGTAARREATGPVRVTISSTTKSLTVRDAAGRTLMHAPVSTGSERDPLPIGEFKVVGVSWNPTFNYNPDLFWDADPSHSKTKIAPGPNNPVGVVWVDINHEHFGLHGTPAPSTIGRTESHGCVRLTNWDATRLGRLVSPGTAISIR